MFKLFRISKLLVLMLALVVVALVPGLVTPPSAQAQGPGTLYAVTGAGAALANLYELDPSDGTVLSGPTAIMDGGT